MSEKWEAVIGLEVHAQLRTDSKLFSHAATGFGAAPNSQVTPVCLGLPGSLPVLNRRAIDLAITAGLATHCEIAPRSIFARKSYFYPDLPKGYQISQFDEPLCLNGYIDVPLQDGSFRAEIERIHVEEDAGKSIHGEGGQDCSWIDLNRAGVPLIEIVGRPDMHQPEQAAAYMRELRAILVYAGVCDGSMEQGSLRCDANVSIRPKGSTELGTRCEIKNMNSFKAVRDAVAYEIQRQIRLVEAGDAVVQQTRLWDAERGRTEAMRGKEHAHDYRYFPDPDLPPLIVETHWIAERRATLPRLPAERREALMALGVSADAARFLCDDKARVDAFEGALGKDAAGVDAGSFANFVIGRAVGALNQSDRDWPDLLSAMPSLLAVHDKWRAAKLSNKMLGDVMRAAFAAPGPLQTALEQALHSAGEAVTDTAALLPVIEDVLAAHADKVVEYRAGKHQLFGFFMGQAMRALKGKADAKSVTTVLKDKLNA